MFKIQKADGQAQLVKCAEDGGIERTYPLVERSLQNGFGTIEIRYCDNIVLHFMRRIGCFFTSGLFFDLGCSDDFDQWLDTAKTIWPTIRNDIYALNGLTERQYDNLMEEISPAILAECPKLRFVSTITVMPKRPKPSGPSSSSTPSSVPSSPEGLYNWLHSLRTDGLPKFARCYTAMNAVKDINDISEAFLTETWPVSYAVAFFPAEKFCDSFEEFSEENGHTKERLTLARRSKKCWILQRGPAGSNWTYEAADKQWADDGKGIKLNFSMDEEFEGCLAEEDDDDAMEGMDEQGDLADEEAEDVDMWESDSNDADLPD
uniref:Uncharacterized protein n=1 Tax=Globodera rostochiensis TaxID=31243 RepID=A0A914HLR1_GLORO